MSLPLTKWTRLTLEEPAVLPLDRSPARTVTSTLVPRGCQPNLPTQGKGFRHLYYAGSQGQWQRPAPLCWLLAH